MASNTSPGKDTACSSLCRTRRVLLAGGPGNSSPSDAALALGLHPRRVPDAVVHGLLWPRLYNANRGQQPKLCRRHTRATNGPAGLLHVTQRERQIHPSSDTTGKRQCDAQPQ